MATVALIRPPSVVTRFALTLSQTPPISIAYLAGSLVEGGHDVRAIDAVGEALDHTWQGYRPDIQCNGLELDAIVQRVPDDARLVGISCMFSNEWPVVRALIAAIARARPSATIVLGGEHATALPDACLRDAPALAACALGEGEETVVELARAIDEGRDLASVPGLVVRSPLGPRRTAPRARIRDIGAIARPAWHLTPLERYLERGLSFGVDRGRTVPMVATRGCPYRCTFCSSPSMWTTRYAMRAPEDVVDEMESHVDRVGADAFDFYDLTAVVKKSWILALCDRLRRRGLRITWQLPSGTRSEAIDGEVARAMHDAGCRNVSYAPESGSPRTLKRIKKQVRLDRMLDSMRAAVGAGLNVKANLILGFPEETREDVAHTLSFAARMAQVGVHDVSVWTFVPYPGSALFDELVAAGTLGPLDDDYYASLLSYSDLAKARSYDARIGDRALQRYRLLGLATFYGASFALHPTRPLGTALRLLRGASARGRYESRAEMSLASLVRRATARTADTTRRPAG
ncbi:B12-binding domain-containing radical SAM protein [Sandaracinus amylolyticus]|uniref:B12-binding domain-containing radical SAM protein n=1 Tax=Sandaracinus amylolyticus TaxID=927083 RepID=UPI001F345581|nr:radical SAM protein [Sandaracinus amylolyticus]